MRKLKLALLAAAAIVPFGWNGATAGAVADELGEGAMIPVDQKVADSLGLTALQTQAGKPSNLKSANCCFVFVWGRWWCIPCG